MPFELSQTLERFRTLAARFRDAAARQDLPTMDEILATRRGLLERITARLGPGAASADQARRSRELLAAILELDREAGELLAKQRDELGLELAALADGRRGLGAYAREGASAGKWIDERG